MEFSSMSQKLSSQTSTFEVEDPTSSPQSFTTVGGVTNIRDLRSGTAAEIDVTDLSSSAKEFILGLADNGTMGLDLIYDPSDAGQIILEELRESSDATNFRVTVPNPIQSPQVTTFTFRGFVQTFPFTLGVDAAMTGTVSIRITGAITKA
jgi:hypothetical protein